MSLVLPRAERSVGFLARIRLPRTRRRRILLGVGVVLLLATPVVALVVDEYVPYFHFRTVQAGAFYRSSQPSAEELSRAIDRYGIRTVVNLRGIRERAWGDWWEREKRVAAEHGVRYVDIPCGGEDPPTPAQVVELLAVWDDPASRPILVHCRHGTVRSAAAEGLWRIEYMGETGPQALDRVTTWHVDLEREHPKVAAFIRDYVPRRDRAADAVRPHP